MFDYQLIAMYFCMAVVVAMMAIKSGSMDFQSGWFGNRILERGIHFD